MNVMTNQTAWPCNSCRSIERAKSELKEVSGIDDSRKGKSNLTKVGLPARAMQAMVWLTPYVLPRDSLFGAANLTSIMFKLGACRWTSKSRGGILVLTRTS